MDTSPSHADWIDYAYLVLLPVFGLIIGLFGKRLVPSKFETRFKKHSDGWQIAFSILVLVLSVTIYLTAFPIWSSAVIIACILGYFVWTLAECGACRYDWLPNRGPALIVVPLCMAAFVILFATAFYRADLDNAHNCASGNKHLITTSETNYVIDRFDCLFMGATVFTTMGDSTTSFTSAKIKTFVMLEQICSFVSLICALSILVSRLSDFNIPIPVGAPLVEKEISFEIKGETHKFAVKILPVLEKKAESE